MAGRRRCRALRYVRTARAFRARYVSAVWSTANTDDALRGTSRTMQYNKANDLANVHVGGRTDHINLDVRPLLGWAQPAHHPRILTKLSKKVRACVNQEDESIGVLTISVFSMSLTVDMRPSENVGSAVLSIRTIAVFS
jgi:hypothetical protein